MQKSESIKEIAIAMSKVQTKLLAVERTSKGYTHNYANLTDVMDLLKKVFPEHGLSYVQSSGATETGGLILETILMHISGEWICGEMPVKLPSNLKADANQLQALGAAISYIRRYALSAMCGVTQVDTDGNHQ